MPSTFAARWASIESSIVQQPRDPVRRVPGLRLRARCTPTTSWPASTARAAATALSTPPLIAARTRILLGYRRRRIEVVGHRGLPGRDPCGRGDVADDP